MDGRRLAAWVGSWGCLALLGCEPSPVTPLPPATLPEAVAPEIRRLVEVERSSCEERPGGGITEDDLEALLARHRRETRSRAPDPPLDTDLRETADRLLESESPCAGSLLLGLLAERVQNRDPSAARGYYARALDAAVSAGDRAAAAGLLNDFGLFHSRRQEVSRALEHYAGARLLWRRLGEQTEWANSHLNVGTLYFRMGRLRDARQVLGEACDRLRRIDDERAPRLLAICLTWRGRLHTAEGSFESAERDLQEALELRRKRSMGLGPGLDALGTLCLERGRFAEAEELFLEAHHEVETPFDRAHAESNLAAAQLGLGRPESALRWSERSMGTARAGQVRDPNLALHNLFVQARAADALGRTELSDLLRERILAAFEDLRRDARGEILLPFFALRRDRLDYFVRGLARRGRAADAFELAEHCRARNLLGQLIHPLAEIRAGSPPELLAEEARLRGSLDRVTGLLDDLLLEGGDGVRCASVGFGPEEGGMEAAAVDGASLVEQSRQLRFRLMALEAEMRRGAGAVGDPSAVDLAEARRLAGPDALLLVYWLSDEGSLLWVIDQEGFRLHEDLPPAGLVESSARRLLRLLAKGPSAADAARREARGLSDALLGPAAAELDPGRPVVIVADGAPALVPFAVLPVPGGDARMVERHAVAYAPSMSVVAAVRSRAEAREGRRSSLVTVIADPVYGFDDPRSPPPSDRGTELPDRLPRLPAAGREAEAIVRGRDARSLTGLDASKARVLGGALGQSRYVHFGTHARVDLAAPDRSALELARVDREGRPIDGSLRLRDLDRLSMSADLVTLAGCDTALGELVPGEGVLALPRGFLHAGAASVVAGLWRVADTPTSLLMEELYRRLIDQDLPPAEALRQAQLKLIRSERWHDPEHWAAFVLIGDWSVGAVPKPG